MSALVEVESLSKSFLIPSVRRETVREHLFALLRPRTFERLEVLRDVSFRVGAGETFGLMGRNGSGKSTLLKLLCGIYRPDGGRVTVRGSITPILELGVGWNPDLDAVDNILLIGTVLGMSLTQARGAVEGILHFAGLERFANLPLKHFSSGMGARLAYAVAFRAVREIIVLDEILAVGDAEFKSRCLARFRELAESGRTIVLVSHEPHHIARYCRRAVLLEGGRVSVEGTGEQVAEAYDRLLSGASVQAA